MTEIMMMHPIKVPTKVRNTPDAEARENLLQAIEEHAPMVWAHINMFGEYDFSDEKPRDAIGILPPKSAA